VQNSAYSAIGGVPVALFGLLMYFTLAAMAMLRLTGWRGVVPDRVSMASWTMLLVGVLYAAYLTYIELWVIDAICQWCVASAVITTLAFAVESRIVWRSLGEPNELER
jgi:uncharacterized membrane protein